MPNITLFSIQYAPTFACLRRCIQAVRLAPYLCDGFQIEKGDCGGCQELRPGDTSHVGIRQVGEEAAKLIAGDALGVFAEDNAVSGKPGIRSPDEHVRVQMAAFSGHQGRNTRPVRAIIGGQQAA